MATKGTYLLLVRLDQNTEVAIGRLGVFAFPAGWYAYAGSALGSGGLEARLARHTRSAKRLHWHIDYLLPHGALEAIWQIASSAHLECVWADAIRSLPHAHILVSGFGSSDCPCETHLCYLPHRSTIQEISRALQDASTGHTAARVRCTVTDAMES